MHLVMDSSRARLEDADNFRQLDLRVSGALEAGGLQGALETLDPASEVDGEHAWVPVAALRDLGRTEDQEWLESFASMIAFAARSGWTRDDEEQVRLHVVS